MKRKSTIIFLITSLFLLASCSPLEFLPWNNVPNQIEPNNEPGPGIDPNPEPEVEEPEYSYNDKEVNLYRKAGAIDKRITLRFFDEQPHIPYIEVPIYFKEFFNTTLTMKKSGNSRIFSISNDIYLGFNPIKQTFFSKGLISFNNHPDFASSTTKLFIFTKSIESTSEVEKVIDLSKYSIKLYGDYVPFSFLSCISGGLALYDVSYNGKDVYVLDSGGQLGEQTNPSSFGDEYESVLMNNEERYQDLAQYNYNELCFVFDNLRGYTEQLIFGDENLLSLGLNKLLEQHAPKIKEYLLSSDKDKYFDGLYALFKGLYDGGHTGILYSNSSGVYGSIMNSAHDEDFAGLENIVSGRSNEKNKAYRSAYLSRLSKFNVSASTYYKFDDNTKTAYIGFNSFDVDYSGWDNYYKNNGVIPVNTDTYAFVRNKFYQALNDNAKNVVLDLTTNGGGNSFALEGIVGLLNKGHSTFRSLNTFNNYKINENHLIDINLDGKCDQLDVDECAKFNFNVGVLTSSYAFSCGNLFPSVLKDLGYKIMGEKSGGGSCAILYQTTADGIQYVHSSYLCLVDANGKNIDGGVEVDFPISHSAVSADREDYSSFYNFQIASNYLSSAYNYS